jgi:hypothetical protein
MTQKREDSEIWEDYEVEAARLVTELQYALALARAVSKKIREKSDIDTGLFRGAERRVYAAYRHVGRMSELLNEIE